jgi:hypothetical protein
MRQRAPGARAGPLAAGPPAKAAQHPSRSAADTVRNRFVIALLMALSQPFAQWWRTLRRNRRYRRGRHDIAVKAA